MGEGGQDCLQIFPDCFGGAWEVYDESPLSNAGLSPGEHAPGRDLHGSIAHGLWNTGGQPVTDCQRGFRGHVSGREAGAAGGDQQIHRPLIAPAPQRGFDLRLFVRYHGGLQNLIACLAQQLCSQRASFVPTLSSGAAVTDRQYGGFVHDRFLLFQRSNKMS